MAMFLDQPYREERPWGEFITFTKNYPSTVKILTINSGQSFSLQYHSHRAEFWYVISGTGTIHIGKDELPITAGNYHVVPEKTEHRVTATDQAVRILEISVGEFDENDITRLEDRYGRVA